MPTARYNAPTVLRIDACGDGKVPSAVGGALRALGDSEKPENPKIPFKTAFLVFFHLQGAKPPLSTFFFRVRPETKMFAMP